MGTQEKTFTASDGTTIFATDWASESSGAENGGVVIMHGLGEHSGRYLHVARFFVGLGLSVRTYDHRGHGRSGGRRGDVPDNDQVMHDAKLVVDDFSQQFDNPPLLFGHSMGGLFAARFAVEQRAPLRGLILSSPALAIAMSGAQKILLKVLNRCAPGLGVSNGLDRFFLSHDAAIIHAYDTDPLVHGKITSRLLTCMLESIRIALSGASRLRIPTLMVVAGDDHIIDSSGSQVFFNLLAPGFGTMKIYPDLFHEIFNEIEAAQVFNDVRNWMEEQQESLASH